MRNNPWNTPWGQFVKTGAPAGANYTINKNRGCRILYYLWMLVLGLFFFACGLYSLGSSLLAAAIFLFLGLFFIIVPVKGMKQ